MTDRLLTIITPFYNSMEFLEIPMNSVLNQTYQNWEYICVDDCSTDGTLEKLRQYAAKDPRIKVIAHEKTVEVPPAALTRVFLPPKGHIFNCWDMMTNFPPIYWKISRKELMKQTPM